MAARDDSLIGGIGGDISNVGAGGGFGGFGSGGSYYSGPIGYSTPSFDAPSYAGPAPSAPSVPAGAGFDLSPIAGLSPSASYQGNRISDISSAYQTFLSGSPVGRGGQYAVSAKKKYGYQSIRDAAAGYLQAAGFTLIQPVTVDTGGGGTTTTGGGGTTTTGGGTTTTTKTPLDTLSDALTRMFGNAQYQPPLQSQVYGYSPVSTGGGGSSLKNWLIIAVVVIIAYFVYKRYGR